MTSFDLIIAGGGAGAFAAAIRANELGAKTLMVNKGLPLGGTCVNVGCVPSKSLLWAGEVMHLARHHQIPGLEIEVKNFDFAKVVRHELGLVEKMRTEKYEKVLGNLEHVTYVDGEARFVSENEVEITDPKNPAPPQNHVGFGAQRRVQGRRFIIATGSTATVPEIENIKEVGYITHIEALKLQTLPKELIVVGAGPVGLEFAQMYARFGTKVTLLHRSSSIFRPAETGLTNRLGQLLTKEGITIKTNVEIQKAYRDGDKKVLVYKQADFVSPKLREARLRSSSFGEAKADEILLAVGKTPNTKELNLNNAGVEVNEKQAVKVNSKFQTSQPHIFAVGDVTDAPLRLETTAGREGTLAAENALDNKQNTIDYNTVPWTIFTDPQLAGVGLTEDEQMKQMGFCACRTVSFEHAPKAIIMNRTEGLINMAIHPETREIMGVHILASNAGELIATAMMLVKNKNTIEDVVNSLPMFPTLSEAIKIAALSFTKDISKLSCCI